MSSIYRTLIKEMLAKEGHLGIDAGWVEAWMRLEYGTLDALSRAEFRKSVLEAVTSIGADPEMSRRLAESYGLEVPS